MENLKTKFRAALHFQWNTQPYKSIIFITFLLYIFLYTWALGDIAYTPGYPSFQAALSAEPLSKIFQSRAAFYFESIALMEIFNITFILSPLNLLMGILLALLVSINVSSSWLAIKLPKVCGTKKGALGILGSLPALFSGLACCVPAIVLIISIQFAAAIVALRSFFFPVAVMLLTLSQLWSLKKLNLRLLKQEELNISTQNKED